MNQNTPAFLYVPYHRASPGDTRSQYPCGWNRAARKKRTLASRAYPNAEYPGPDMALRAALSGARKFHGSFGLPFPNRNRHYREIRNMYAAIRRDMRADSISRALMSARFPEIPFS
jgi:hypothetical protein